MEPVLNSLRLRLRDVAYRARTAALLAVVDGRTRAAGAGGAARRAAAPAGATDHRVRRRRGDRVAPANSVDGALRLARVGDDSADRRHGGRCQRSARAAIASLAASAQGPSSVGRATRRRRAAAAAGPAQAARAADGGRGEPPAHAGLRSRPAYAVPARSGVLRRRRDRSRRRQEDDPRRLGGGAEDRRSTARAARPRIGAPR